jgi:glycosyltransferase involved in cell wall biosynthesis
MNILYIWDADYPWDIRVEKICMSLAANNHTVHIAARNLKKRKEYELLNGLHIHRTRVFPSGFLNYALSFPLFFSPIWHGLLDKIIRENKIDLIIVRDLPMAIAGVWAAKRWKIPVHFDMAEDYVAMLWNVWKHKGFSPINLIVRNPYLARLIERYAMKRMDHIFVVVEETVSVVKKAGGDPKKVTIVSNTPVLSAFEGKGIEIPQANIQKMKARFSIIYCGNMLLERGINLAIDAIEHIKKEITDFQFVFIGTGYALNDLKAQAHAKGFEDYIWWLGWVEHPTMLQYMKMANIGIIPDFVTPHTNTTIPNKIFDYMACGIPVVAAASAPMKRVIDSERCGEVFESGDVQGLANAIIKIKKSNFDYGANGKKAVIEKYNWSMDEKRLLEVIHHPAIH